MPWPRGKYGDSYGGWGNTFEEACANQQRDLGRCGISPSDVVDLPAWLKLVKQGFRQPKIPQPRADGTLTKTEEKRKAIKERRRARLEANLAKHPLPDCSRPPRKKPIA